MTNAQGMAVAEIARAFFDIQLHYADVFAEKAGLPLAEAITFHTNFHRLFAYGNLAKASPDPDFVALVADLVAIEDPALRLDHLVAAYADRPHDTFPPERFAFGRHFACEAPNEAGAVRIHFRNRVNTDSTGPLHAANLPQRRAELKDMVGFIARTWPAARTINGASWLYNTEAYRRLFPAEFGDSRMPLVGPRPIHGLSTWGQFLDFRGHVKPDIVETFRRNLHSLDPARPWESFPYQVLVTVAPLDAFRRAYGA